MLKLSEDLGIEKVLVDPATMPVGAGYGLEYRTILAVKSELGLPTCLGPHNAPSAWRFIKETGFNDESTHLAAIVASTVISQVFATDSIMYGSMIRTKEVLLRLQKLTMLLVWNEKSLIHQRTSRRSSH